MILPALVLVSMAIAQDAELPPSVVSKPKSVTRPVPKKKEKNQKREKETEGTEALNRFKTQAPNESHYTFGGERLEVDPD